MQSAPPTLHLLCGKIASGKSTLAAELSLAHKTVVIAEDEWLSALFSDQMSSGADYLRCSSKLQTIIAPHVSALLSAGLSVVLDFAANTVSQRRWMQKLAQQTGVHHEMHVLTPPDDVCLDRLRARNAKGEHPFAATEAQFHQFSKHFVAPTPDEGFNLIWH